MKKIREFLINSLLRLIGNKAYKTLTEKEAKRMLSIIASDPDLKRFPDLLSQLADGYKNQYMFSNDPLHKGLVTAFTLLRERLVEHKPSTKKKEAERQKKLVGDKSKPVKY